jgi:hypothetical protein
LSLLTNKDNVEKIFGGGRGRDIYIYMVTGESLWGLRKEGKKKKKKKKGWV